MSRIAVIAALPMELKPLVRGWTHQMRNGVDVWTRDEVGRTWIAACAGCGPEAARRAFQEAVGTGTLNAVCSVGVAGALVPNLEGGSVHLVAVVVDAVSGQRFAVARDVPGLCLVSTDSVASPEDKRRLAAAHGAGLVDMEAAEVARLALDAGIPFYCLKGVSDGPADRLPPMSRYMTPEGRLRMAGLVAYVALRPWLWPGMLRLGSHTRRAVRGFAGPLRSLLGWPS